MTVDDAAAILDVTEGHLKDLVRDGAIRGRYAIVRGRRQLKAVNGQDVRQRRRRLNG